MKTAKGSQGDLWKTMSQLPLWKKIGALLVALATIVGTVIGIIALLQQNKTDETLIAILERLLIVDTHMATRQAQASEALSPPTATAVAQELAQLKSTKEALERERAAISGTPLPQATSTALPESTPVPTNTPTGTPTNTPTHTPTHTPTNTPTSTPTNTPEPEVPGSFVDNFDGELKEEWEIAAAGYNISNGLLTGDGFIILYQPSTNDYVIKARIQGSNFDILFRREVVRDRYYEGYSFSCSEAECFWQKFDLVSYGAGQAQKISTIASLGDRRSYFETKSFHTLIIKVKGSRFAVSVDNETVLSSTGDENHAIGKVGIGGIDGAIDSFAVIPLE